VLGGLARLPRVHDPLRPGATEARLSQGAGGSGVDPPLRAAALPPPALGCDACGALHVRFAALFLARPMFPCKKSASADWIAREVCPGGCPFLWSIPPLSPPPVPTLELSTPAGLRSSPAQQLSPAKTITLKPTRHAV